MLERYQTVRDRTERIARPLSAEDQVIQSMPDASPAKWHLAHTTWFFEQFLLRPYVPGYRPVDDRYGFLFNSYYEAAGPRQPRPRRGMMTRPSAQEVLGYRHQVDAAMRGLLGRNLPEAAAFLVGLGLNHEEQHQELLVTDALHALSQNPLRPAYDTGWVPPAPAAAECRFLDGPAGLVMLGQDRGPGAESRFSFDNEGPRHRVWLDPYRIAARPVTNGEWLEFMAAGGYSDPLLWMSDGWAQRCEEGWEAPLYWERNGDGHADGHADGSWHQFGLGGLLPVDPAATVRHISWYEADAFARWAGKRLPTEAEWEAAAGLPGLEKLESDVWQWTGSAYRPYPGYQPWAGAVGEYNGKFMINQMVLRGGSLATPPGHARTTYRNFFPPEKRWQFTGLRLAEDAA